MERDSTLKQWTTHVLTTDDTSNTDQRIDNGRRCCRELNTGNIICHGTTDSDPSTTIHNTACTTNTRRWRQRSYPQWMSQQCNRTLTTIPGNKQRLDERPVHTTAHSYPSLLCKELGIYNQCMVSNVIHIHD